MKLSSLSFAFETADGAFQPDPVGIRRQREVPLRRHVHHPADACHLSVRDHPVGCKNDVSLGKPGGQLHFALLRQGALRAALQQRDHHPGLFFLRSVPSGCAASPHGEDPCSISTVNSVSTGEQ